MARTSSRAFVRLRQLVVNHKAIAAQLAALPFAFTEHEAIKAANVINSTTAAEMGWQSSELDAASTGTTINSPLSSLRSAK